MHRSLHNRVLAWSVLGLIAAAGPAAARPGTKAGAVGENLARRATVTANSEYSGNYLARFVADGQVPGPGSKADLNKAWCVKGDTHKHDGTLTFAWPKPVTVAQIVYFGRTAWYAEECWRDYTIHVDGAGTAAAKGTLQRGHGPQIIRLPRPVSARTLTLKFTKSYGGMNPGASEVQIYATPTPKGALGEFVALPNGQPGRRPAAKAVAAPVKESPQLRRRLLAGELGFDKLVMIHRHAIRPTHVYTQHCEGFRAGGGLGVMTLTPEGPTWKQLVPSPEGQVLDLDVSYDGREIVFSWRRTTKDPYHVFRVKADGSDLTQLTRGAHHNYNVCWLPDGGIAFLSSREPQFAYCWISPVGIVHRMDRDGKNVRRLSANYLNDFTPAVTADGRIIYGRWEYVDRPAIPIQSLWTINPDGTGLRVFYGNRVLSPATFIEPRSIPGTNQILCVLTAHNGPCRGGIGILDPAYGVNAQEAIRNLTPEVNIGQVDKGSGNGVRGPYENPYPIDRTYFLVSKLGTVLVRDYDGSEQAVVTAPADGLGFYSPQPLRPRPRPPVVESSLPPKPDGPWATVVLQDVYQGLGDAVERGEVKSVCVVQEISKSVRTSVGKRAFGFQFPVISCGATYAAKKVWGYVPVADDGSASFRVPAGVPIYFMAVDAQGRAVQRMRSFTHLMPGETQGCIGCHEPRRQTSRPTRPSTVAKAHKLLPPEWGLGGFDYSVIVQPVLNKYCIQCHSGIDAPKKIDLTGDKTDFFCMSYEMLARGRRGHGAYDNPYTKWIPTYNGHEANILEIRPKHWGSPASKLAELILSGHPDENGQVRFRMDAVSRQRVFAWIDLNVPYYGTSETAYPEAKGCRRLYPAGLDRVLADVAKRRCASCHKGGKIPRPVWTRITRPELNPFLLAPLSRVGGGRGVCRKGGKPVFASTDDPDYQKILATFAPLLKQVKDTPRMDMPGAQPDPTVNRSCQ